VIQITSALVHRATFVAARARPVSALMEDGDGGKARASSSSKRRYARPNDYQRTLPNRDIVNESTISPRRTVTVRLDNPNPIPRGS